MCVCVLGGGSESYVYLHAGVNIFINLVSPNLEYLEWTFWNTGSGRVLPAVRREFDSPLVTKPVSHNYLCEKIMRILYTCYFHFPLNHL